MAYHYDPAVDELFQAVGDALFLHVQDFTKILSYKGISAKTIIELLQMDLFLIHEHSQLPAEPEGAFHAQ